MAEEVCSRVRDRSWGQLDLRTVLCPWVFALFIHNAVGSQEFILSKVLKEEMLRSFGKMRETTHHNYLAKNCKHLWIPATFSMTLTLSA